MWIVTFSYFIQAAVALLVFLAFAHFASKGEDNLASFNICEKFLGCLCKTLPLTVRIFTVIGTVLVLWLTVLAYLPECTKITSKPPVGFEAHPHPWDGMPKGIPIREEAGKCEGFWWLGDLPEIRKALEGFQDDCRPAITPGLQDQVNVAVIVVIVQFVLGFGAKSIMVPPPWLYVPRKPGKGLGYMVGSFLRAMGP
jgi:hypothetical protein